MRLKTHIRVAALLRQAEAAGLFGTVLRRGDADGGVVLVVTREGGAVALHAERDGRFAPRADALGAPSALSELIDREAAFDRDLWVVEIEGRGAGALLSAFEA